MIQKPTQKTWRDETGMEIPVTRLTGLEKKKERYVEKLFTKAERLSALLKELKLEMESSSQDLLQQSLKENDVKGKPRKGNFTFYSFDREIKVEVDINERIEFDSLLIKACQEKLNEFLSDNLKEKQEYFRVLIQDAFSTSGGKLDTRKVMSLLKHKSKIKADQYHQAMDLLEQSIRRPDSKTYFRISKRNSKKEYEPIILNIAAL